MGFLPKKWLNRLWGVEQPTTRMAKAIDCDACKVARMNGSDACWEHHQVHERAHTYHAGHEMNFSSGLDGVMGTPGAMPARVSAASISEEPVSTNLTSRSSSISRASYTG